MYALFRWGLCFDTVCSLPRLYSDTRGHAVCLFLQALDLLTRVLRYDHNERITAKEAMVWITLSLPMATAAWAPPPLLLPPLMLALLPFSAACRGQVTPVPF